MSETNQELPEQFSDILLTLDQKKKEIRAVKGLDKDGNLETTEAKRAHQNEFLKIDKHGDLLSNFLSNYFRQAKDPTRFRFFKVSIKQLAQLTKAFNEYLKKPTKPMSGMLQKYEIDTTKFNLKKEEKMTTKAKQQDVEYEEVRPQQKESKKTKNTNEQSDYRYQEKDIDWTTLSNFGITKEKLEKRNLLQGLLKGYKTNELVPVSLNLGTAFSRLDARLSLQKNEEGKVTMAIHGIRRKPMLNYPFFGHEFSDADKKNLLQTGNMGRVVDLENTKTGEMIPSIISVDKLTNELVALKAEYIKIPDEIKGVALSEKQKQCLLEGKSLHLEKMISTKGTVFNATLQFNADKRYVEFIFDTPAQKKVQKQRETLGEIPKVIRGKALTDPERENLKNGKTIYIDGFLSKEGKSYTGYLNYNSNNGKVDFSFKNPNTQEDKVGQETSKKKSQKAEETPKKSKGIKR
ncbi:DUF4099 domain-containing protein [uncultured Polaribacter sp.]|uniref:DUF4099 domain-containing protein n=1 Tax=uncultured Polaribacter sp. TaxID=174711 RepID=UPI002638933F|nr:DUF4099 domain-containing protein [uncultured Polaribacter sp.]